MTTKYGMFKEHDYLRPGVPPGLASSSGSAGPASPRGQQEEGVPQDREHGLNMKAPAAKTGKVRLRRAAGGACGAKRERARVCCAQQRTHSDSVTVVVVGTEAAWALRAPHAFACRSGPATASARRALTALLLVV